MNRFAGLYYAPLWMSRKRLLVRNPDDDSENKCGQHGVKFLHGVGIAPKHGAIETKVFVY